MIIINSDRSLAELKGKLDRDYKDHKYLTVKVTKAKRSTVANALQFHWYKELSQQGDETGSYYRAYCKYYFGLAIRAEDDPEFAEPIRSVLERLDHELRLELMKHMDVTSTFNRDQMSRYLTEIKQHFEPQGYVLTNSEDY